VDEVNGNVTATGSSTRMETEGNGEGGERERLINHDLEASVGTLDSRTSVESSNYEEGDREER